MNVGNAVASMGRVTGTRFRYSPSRNACPHCFAQLRHASALSKKPGTNLTHTPKTKASTKLAGRSLVKAAYPRVVAPAVNKSSLVVRPSASSRLALNSMENRNLEGFQHKVLEDAFWPKDTQIITVPSGAQLSYARLGRLKEVGPCCVLFDGSPGSRLSWCTIHEYAERHKVRIIAVDRPGYGYSTLHDRGLQGFIQDLEHLLDYRGIEEFVIHATSGGAPAALAAAHYFPKARLKRTSIMCGTSHPRFKKSELKMKLRLDKWLTGWTPLEVFYDPQVALYMAIKKAGNDEKKIRFQKALHREMFRQNTEGLNNDMRLANRPWGFNLEDIDANPIKWYHGTADANTSFSAAKKTAEAANYYRHNIAFKAFPGLDHHNIQDYHFWELFKWLLR